MGWSSPSSTGPGFGSGSPKGPLTGGSGLAIGISQAVEGSALLLILYAQRAVSAARRCTTELNGVVPHKWLEHWDRRNQATLEGVIPDAVRARWRWERRLDEAGREELVLGHVTLNDLGARNSLVLFPWDTVSYLTYEAGRGFIGLTACVRGEPRMKHLMQGFGMSFDIRHNGGRLACIALLQDCESFVVAHGARVYAKPDVTEMWWAGQPESRRP